MESHRLAMRPGIHKISVRPPENSGQAWVCDTGDTGHHRQRDSEEAIINNSDVGDAARPKQVQGTSRHHQGDTRFDRCGLQKIFTINRLENKEGRSFFREVFIRRGQTSNVQHGVEEPHECYMTHTTERAEKEALKLYKRG